MRILTSLLATSILAAGAASVSDAAADLTVVSKVTANGEPAGVDTNYISNDHIPSSREQGTETIVDLKSGVMSTLNDKQRTYYVVTMQDLQKLQAKMAERMNDPRMKQAMAAMQGMSAAMASSYEVKKTGATRSVAGFACEEWRITMGPMMTMTECVTSQLQYPVQAWQAFADFTGAMRKAMGSFGPSAKSSADLAEKLRSMKGFPVASTTTIDVAGHKTTTASEVIEVRRTPIPASTWVVPAGFRQVDNPMMKAFEKHVG